MSLVILLSSVLGTVVYAQRATECTPVTCYLLPFIALVTVQTLVSIIYHVILYPYYLSPLRHLTRVEQAPFWRRLLKEPAARTLSKWINEVPNDGLIRYFGLFNQERILVTRTQGCKEVLHFQSYNYIKFPWALEVMGQVVPLSLLVAAPKKHKVDRKLLQPAFKVPYIKSLYPAFWSESSKFLSAIEKDLPGLNLGVLDIGNMLHHVTLDIITFIGFGGSVNAVANSDSEGTKQYRNLFSAKRSHIYYRLWAMVLPLWIYRRLPVKARYEIKSAIKNVRASMLPLIQLRRVSAVLPEKDAESISQGDIIATLLKSGDSFSDDYLMDQAMGFIVAGQETTATAVTFALYLLSEHPEIQTRLRQEIRSNLVSPNLEMSTGSTDVESLPCLTAVCNEVLRLYPPVPDVRRIVIAPNTVVESTPMPIGTVVTVAPWSIHRSKEIWGPKADVFYPERWFVDGSSGTKIDPLGGCDNPHSMMTFTYGARACIGEKFARGEMLTLVAQLVGRFEWKFKGIGPKGDKEMKLAFGVTLAPVGGGMTMYTRKISGW